MEQTIIHYIKEAVQNLGLLVQTDSIEVLEPQSVRNQMRNFAKNMYHHYKDDKKK